VSWIAGLDRRRRQSEPWWYAAGALLVVAIGCIAVGLPYHRHPLAPPVAAASVAPLTPPRFTVKPVPVVARSVPVSLRIPAIVLSVPLSSLGINPDGTVQVPTGVTEPGWFRLGPTPGQIGSAVILGHVDSYQGPGVFFQLRALVPGDLVQVSLTDGAVTTFAVTLVATYTKTQFPSQQVYGSQGTSTLQLVTCGGAFDTATGHYLSNIVVYTSFVSATAATIPTAATTPTVTAATTPTDVAAAL
jgi:hypothetical protein